MQVQAKKEVDKKPDKEAGGPPPLTEQQKLVRKKNGLLNNYRGAVKWACNALEYKRRFEREEDYGDDGLQEHITFLKEDSRREIKRIAMDIRVLRKQIDGVDKSLMDLGKEKGNE